MKGGGGYGTAWHKGVSQGRGRVKHCRDKVWSRSLKTLMKAHMSCKDLGWARLGQNIETGLGLKTEAGLGQNSEAGKSMVGPKNRGSAEAKTDAGQSMAVKPPGPSMTTLDLRHQLHRLHLGMGARTE
jgi:hypothetical protein